MVSFQAERGFPQIANGFFSGRTGFSAMAGWVFLLRKAVTARECLLEIDTSLAIATSGWTTILPL